MEEETEEEMEEMIAKKKKKTIPCPHCGKREGWLAMSWERKSPTGRKAWRDCGEGCALVNSTPEVVSLDRIGEWHSVDICRACGGAIS